MSEQSESFATEAEELFERKMREFVQWTQANWRLDHDDPDTGLSGDQVDGWNRCVEGLSGAVDLWLEGGP